MRASYRGDLVLESGVLEGGYLSVENGRINYVGSEKPPIADIEREWDGAWIFPGGVDAQVHARSQKGAEGFDACTRAAAAGGVTTIVDMPYDEEYLVCSAESVRMKASDAEREARVDVALYGTINPDEGAARIREQVEAGVAAFKFSTFGTHPKRFPRVPPYLMERAFSEIAKHGLAAGVHNENDEIIRHELETVSDRGITDYTAHGLSRPPISELLAICEIYELGAHTGCRAHVVHCSLARGIDIRTSYRKQGFACSVEVCLHYLVLTEEDDVRRLGGLGKINPPIRSRSEREGLWTRLASGEIDIVSTDHVSWPLESKSNPEMLANASGAPGIEVMIPILARECVSRGVCLGTLARVLAGNPARHFGLAPSKGSLKPGADADFCVIDPATSPYRAARGQTVAGWSAYEGREIPKVLATYLRGQCVWDGSEIVQPRGFGRFARPAPAR